MNFLLLILFGLATLAIAISEDEKAALEKALGPEKVAEAQHILEMKKKEETNSYNDLVKAVGEENAKALKEIKAKHDRKKRNKEIREWISNLTPAQKKAYKSYVIKLNKLIIKEAREDRQRRLNTKG